MDEGMRILVASPLGKIVAPTLAQAFKSSTVAVAVDRESVRQLVTTKYRYDVVVADLIWNNPDLEFSFDGLDVVNLLQKSGRLAPVLLAAQGHSMERDHLDEAGLHPEVAGIYQKTSGVEPLLTAIGTAVQGDPAETTPALAVSPKALHQYFIGQRGVTAARLAGAIAAGRSSDGPSLSRAAHVGINTANKVARVYLGPIIEDRGEAEPGLRMTSEAVYRWCGLHARYLVSWCRRHGHGDVLRPEQRGDTPYRSAPA
ncbi:response regulator [Nocardia wallacei]|uniref:response regulator n=1 Tax=Nocardia wallacei TaxID=480035 RepID=UPI002456BBCD|nr:response regulator [Nocardia wallacei]